MENALGRDVFVVSNGCDCGEQTPDFQQNLHSLILLTNKANARSTIELRKKVQVTAEIKKRILFLQL